MPGCFRQRQKILRRWTMPNGSSGRGRGGSDNSGRGSGRGRMRGKPDGICICPKCGYTEEHLRGTPCFENRCPKCNIPLQRG